MKYWAYINNEILGPYEREQLLELPVFSASTLLCPQTPAGEKTEEWKEASTIAEVAEILKNHEPAAKPPEAAPLTAPGPEPALSPLPKPEQASAMPPLTPLTGGPAEQPKPGDAQLQPGRLNSLKPHGLEPAPPSQGAPASAFEVSHLNSAKEAAPRPAPSFSSSFDPMTISQIGKRAPHPAPEEPKAAPAPAAQPPETPPQQPALGAGTDLPFEQNQSNNGHTQNPDPLSDIRARLEALSRSALTKQDLEPLREKLTQLSEALFSIKNNPAQTELPDRVQRLEQTLSEMRNTGSFAAAQPLKEETLKPAEPRLPKKGTETLVVDQGSRGSGSALGKLAGRLFKYIFISVSLAALLGGGLLALKYFNVFDIGPFLPFQIPLLSEPKTEPAAPAPFQQEAAGNQDAQTSAPADQQPPAAPKKDLGPEVLYFARNYPTKPRGITLENRLLADAAARKGNFNKIDYKTTERPGGRYDLVCTVPTTDGSAALTYRYEVDYAGQAVKAADQAAARTLEERPAAKQTGPARPQAGAKKGRTASYQLKPARQPARQAAPRAARQEKPRAPAKPAEDEEFEYVYEDEAAASEE